MDHNFVTTAFELPGVRVAKSLGVVRGIIVRSRSVIVETPSRLSRRSSAAISRFTPRYANAARSDAYELMIRHAEEQAPNAVLGVRYDANEIAPGVTEVLCYGTAVHVVPGSYA